MERLEARQRLSVAAQQRLDVLWSRAFRDHQAPQMDPMMDFARQVGERMWARLPGAGRSSE